MTEPRRCNWGQQLQVLEHVEVFQTVILLSVFFFGLECSFFRTANAIMDFFVLSIWSEGIVCLNRQIICLSIPFECSAGKRNYTVSCVQSYHREAEVLYFEPETDQTADSGSLSKFSAGSFTPVWLLLSWGLKFSDWMVEKISSSHSGFAWSSPFLTPVLIKHPELFDFKKKKLNWENLVCLPTQARGNILVF